MSGHTPGPWSLWVGGAFGEYGTVTDDAKARHLARMVNGAPETAANARLIAAAPDLLEASREALHTLDAQARSRGGQWASAVIGPLRAAIAKATEANE